MCKKHILFAFCVVTIVASHQAYAVTSEKNLNGWIKYIEKQLQTHPEIISAKQKLAGQFHLADGLEKAIYNPELSTEYEKEGPENNFTVGINQSIDRSDKRKSRSQQAVFLRAQARENYHILMQDKIAQALTALVNYQSILKKSKLTLKQENQLEKLIELVQEKTRSGDMGQLDAELAYLTLSQKFAQTASIQAQKQKARSKLTEILPEWQSENLDESTPILFPYDETEAEQVVDDHPLVKMAKAKWEVAEIKTELAQKNKKADPTVGVNVGKVDNDNLVSLNFSMPLNFRNDFSEEYKAAREQALAAESAYLNAKRSQYFEIIGSQKAVREYKKRFQKWQKLMQGRDKDSELLLEKQWKIGDIGTSDYFLTLQQRTDGLLSGITLEQDYKTAVIQLLLDTAQLKQETLLTQKVSQ
jgi:outer membrane protein TolC